MNELDILRKALKAMKNSNCDTIAQDELEQLIISKENKAPIENPECSHKWEKSHSKGMQYCVYCGKYKPEGMI